MYFLYILNCCGVFQIFQLIKHFYYCYCNFNLIFNPDLERAQSTTRPMKSMSHDKEHFFLPLWDTKPCVHVISKWPDQTKRMFTSNALEKIVDNYVSFKVLLFQPHN